jgi:hypothetical protein
MEPLEDEVLDRVHAARKKMWDDARRRGLSVEEFIEEIQQKAMRNWRGRKQEETHGEAAEASGRH